jgi:hypothetical protein
LLGAGLQRTRKILILDTASGRVITVAVAQTLTVMRQALQVIATE